MDKRTPTVTVSPLFFCLLAVLLLYEPKGMAAGCLAASLFHEGGHLTVLLFRKAMPKRVVIGVFGMRIEKDERVSLSFWDDFLIAAGGPAANVVCGTVLWLCRQQTMAVIHLTMAGVNLLPIYSLDGGAMLQSVMYRYCSPQKAEYVLRIVSLCVVFPLGVFGFFVLIQSGYNVSLLVMDVYLMVLLFFKR